MSRPLTFAFSIFPYSRFENVEEIAEVVVLGEELGLDAVLLPEHLLPPLWPTADISTKLWFDLPALASFLAARTTRLKLVTNVMVVPYHPPIQMAKALATLDVLSKGRVMLGVGAGWMKAEFRRLGVPFDQRGDITDEYLRAMRELWTSDAPSFSGNYVSFDDVSFLPRPVQPGGIPILIGGTGARPFRRLAEIGSGWLPMSATLPEIVAGMTEIERHMATAGRSSEVANLVIGGGVSIGDDAETRRMQGHVAGRSLASVPARSPADAVSEIQQLVRAGVNLVSLSAPWRTRAELERNLRLFATDVIPAFR